MWQAINGINHAAQGAINYQNQRSDAPNLSGRRHIGVAHRNKMTLRETVNATHQFGE